MFNGSTLQERDRLSRQSTTLPHCILSSNNIVKFTALVVARRVPFFLGRDPVVRDALTVFGKQPDADNEEVVPKEPQALQHILIDDADELIAKPALLIHKPVPARVAVCQTSAEFDGIDCEKVNPKLAAIFCNFLGQTRQTAIQCCPHTPPTPLATIVLPAPAHAATGLRPVFEALLSGLAHVVSTCAVQTNEARASSWSKRIASAKSLTK